MNIETMQQILNDIERTQGLSTFRESFKELESLVIDQHNRIKELESAINDEIANYFCPDAIQLEQDYCARASACSACRNKKFLKELIK